jgi:hypothetical protein
VLGIPFLHKRSRLFRRQENSSPTRPIVWCGDQRELLIKIGAVTGLASGRLTKANQRLKSIAASAEAKAKIGMIVPEPMV